MVVVSNGRTLPRHIVTAGGVTNPSFYFHVVSPGRAWPFKEAGTWVAHGAVDARTVRGPGWWPPVCSAAPASIERSRQSRRAMRPVGRIALAPAGVGHAAEWRRCPLPRRTRSPP